MADAARRVSRVRRRWRLGWGFRFAVVVLWPLLMAFTKRDWEGEENLDLEPGGIVVATNHLSWFDPLSVSLLLWNNDRPPRFLAKESVFSVPFVGSVIRSAGQIPVYRETTDAIAAVRDAVSAIERRECVVVYPEGTITRDPDLWPMEGKTGAARIALITGCPVIPIAQWGPQWVIGPYRREFRLLPRKTMHLRVGPPVDLDDLRSSPLDAQTVRIATERIIAAITTLLEGVRGEAAPAVRYRLERKAKP